MNERARILLIDDQAIVGAAVRQMLHGEDDLELRFCQDPEQAIAMAVATQPAVILQDLVMPGVEGIALVRALRAEPATRDVPLIVLSTKEEPETKVAAFAAGANDYLVKLPDRLELLARLRYHAASHRAHAALKRQSAFVRDTFGRYVSDQVVASLLETPGGLAFGGDRRVVTILMCDLRGFTGLTERLPPEQVVAMLNNHFEVMTEIIARHGGTVDELIGDAILAIFGAPIQRDDDARRAMTCALEMQLAVPRVNERNAAAGLPPISMGIGLDTGEVVAGNLGSRQRAKYGVVGMHVVTASRIEGHTLGGQILASASTRAAVGPDLRIDDELELAQKGTTANTQVVSVRGLGGLELAPQGEPEPLATPLPARYTCGDDPTVHAARVVRITQTGAQLAAAAAPAVGTAIRLEVMDDAGGVRWAGIRARVASPSPEGFRIRFSPVPLDVIAFVRRL
ncbi:MAG TPA: adenylate/guanylate cyclase domain-containing protein [Kofleriaceae bacterium]|jgi:adenylate cyclase|nr:adenylate/guanylate cyclase domain-containing protein [Kofleriaceae bacterium]